MSFLDEFADILKRDEPLAPYTWLKVGGLAQFFLEPRSVDELTRAVKGCCHEGIPVRVLGGGSTSVGNTGNARTTAPHPIATPRRRATRNSTFGCANAAASTKWLLCAG